MGRKDALRRAIESYLDWVGRTRAQETWETYRYVLNRIRVVVQQTGTTTYLSHWGVREIQTILAARAHLLPSTRRLDIAVLRSFFKWMGSPVMENALRDGAFTIPRRSRVNVRWHSEETLALVRAACRSDMTYYMVMLASEVGLRRGEIARLKISDIHGDTLVVRGKGGFMVPVPLTRLVAEDLDRAVQRRAKIILEAGASAAPEELFIYRRGAEVHAYTPDTISNRIRAAGQAVGVHLSPHDCRRSCGRELWRATHDLISTNQLLRHSSLDQTREYIGADLEDARAAMLARESKRAPTAPLETPPVIVEGK